MNAKHTPGPYVLDGTQTVVLDSEGFGLADVHETAVLQNWADLDIEHWSRRPGVSFRELPEEELLANGVLFAAAPELLEVCEDLLEIVCDLSVEENPDLLTPAKRAHTAIAKAKGEKAS